MIKLSSKLFTLFLLILPFSSCKTVMSISINQIPAEAGRKNRIVASASNPIILLFPFGSSYPDRARQDFLDQCPKGTVEGVVSKHQRTEYLSLLFMIDEVILEGYCKKKSSQT